jgi:hypothetical protein
MSLFLSDGQLNGGGGHYAAMMDMFLFYPRATGQTEMLRSVDLLCIVQQKQKQKQKQKQGQGQCWRDLDLRLSH